MFQEEHNAQSLGRYMCLALLLHPKDTDVVGMRPLSDVVVEQIRNIQLQRGKSEALD